MDNPSLKEYLESIVAALEKRFEDEKDHIAERSKLLASNFDQWREDNDRRLEGMNEMRAQLNRAEGVFVSQPVQNAKNEALEARLSLLEQIVSGTRASKDTSIVWIGSIIAVCAVLVVVVMKLWK